MIKFSVPKNIHLGQIDFLVNFIIQELSFSGKREQEENYKDKNWARAIFVKIYVMMHFKKIKVKIF